MKKKFKIGVIGLGYVGLPLAVEFGKKINTVGFDINQRRIEELKHGKDITLEVFENDLNKAVNLTFTSSLEKIIDCNVYIITVPTPVDDQKKPDLIPLKKASMLVGEVLKINDIVIYESTVFPGATEEFCVPILEKSSKLRFNRDFFCGYSPERINPGDKKHRIVNIKKITSGSTAETTETVDFLYKSIITAGTHKVSSIKVAEAAKVIENTQRDVNIALINELAIIFNKLNIDTEQVLEAAETKWNFISFRPGLVGGHCIGVDPYYLTYKAEQAGYQPKMILAGRFINDNMGAYIAENVVDLMFDENIQVDRSSVLILGLAFKENCPDIRNTRVIDIIDKLKTYNINISVHDPWVDSNEVNISHNINLIDEPEKNAYDAIIIAVAHNQYKKLGAQKLRLYGKKKHILYDVKYLLNNFDTDGRL